MASKLVRYVPYMRGILGPCRHYGAKAAGSTSLCQRRCFMGPPWRRDPFAQMESFMKDVERKFKEQIQYFDSVFKDFPRLGSWSMLHDDIRGPVDSSSSDKFKLTFGFRNAKPEDIKVTLKDRKLTVSARIQESTETSKVSQEMVYEYQIPEGVNIDALESSLAQDGILTVEAPRVPPEGPKAIPINKE